MDKKQRLLEAVNALVARPEAPDEIMRIPQAARVIDEGLQIALTGDYAYLNPLLELYCEDRTAFHNVMKLVNRKRGLVDLPPIPDVDARTRGDYMRNLVAQRRARERLAVEVENAERPAAHQLRGASRMAFLRKLSAQWTEQRTRWLDNRLKELGGERLPRHEYINVSAAFWQHIDDELHRRLRELRRPK